MSRPVTSQSQGSRPRHFYVPIRPTRPLEGSVLVAVLVLAWAATALAVAGLRAEEPLNRTCQLFSRHAQTPNVVSRPDQRQEGATSVSTSSLDRGWPRRNPYPNSLPGPRVEGLGIPGQHGFGSFGSGRGTGGRGSDSGGGGGVGRGSGMLVSSSLPAIDARITLTPPGRRYKKCGVLSGGHVGSGSFLGGRGARMALPTGPLHAFPSMPK